MLLSKEQILAAEDLPKKRVNCPEWGEGAWVFVRTLSAAERDRFEAGSVELAEESPAARLANIRARFCALCICDEAGQPLFTPADAEALGKKSARALDRIFAVAQRLNGMRKQDLEELEKN